MEELSQQVEMLLKVKARLEAEVASVRREQKREVADREDELEDARNSAAKKVKLLELQLEQEHEERKEGKRRDATVVIGSLLLYAQVQVLTPFIPEKRSTTTASWHPLVLLSLSVKAPTVYPSSPSSGARANSTVVASGLDSAGENPLLLEPQNQEPHLYPPPNPRELS